MKKWNLIMGQEALENYLIPEHIPAREKEKREKQNKLINLLNEHRIVYSDSLLSFLEKQEDKSLYVELRDWVSAGNYVDGPVKAEECECKSFSDWILKITQNELVKNWLVIVKNKAINDQLKKIFPQKVYGTDELLSQTIDNKVIRDSKYCQMPVDIELDGKIIQEWMNELFENEKEVYIFDCFICNKDGFKNFKKLYAKALKGKIVHLFVSQYELDKNIDKKTQWCQIAKNNNMELVFHTSKDPEHDRYIFLDNDIIITIGLGTDLLDDTDKTREITMIHVLQGSNPSRESLCKKHPYGTSKSFSFKFRN